MIHIGFGNLAFNYESSEQTIDMIISGKNECESVEDFFQKAISYLITKIYPGVSLQEEYRTASVEVGKEDDKEQIKKWIDGMNQKIEVNFDEIILNYRVKRNAEYSVDENIFETKEEYVLILWCTTA